MAILAVNAGSSTLKFSIYPLLQGQVQSSVLTGNIQGLESGGNPVLGWTFQGRQHQHLLPSAKEDPFGQALHSLGDLLTANPALPPLTAVAHRVVHGGRDFTRSVQVSPEILDRLAQFNALAPLHQPNNLRGIRAFQTAFPALPQVACFDTAFRADLP